MRSDVKVIFSFFNFIILYSAVLGHDRVMVIYVGDLTPPRPDGLDGK